MKVAVITCSNRSAAGERPDESGELLVTLAQTDGHQVTSRCVVPDQIDAIRAAVTAAVRSGVSAILTTGGTGIAPSDVTPEAVHPLLEREVPGIAEALRLAARDRVPTSVLSRGVAGTIGPALVVTLPGSPGGVRDGWSLLSPILPHAAAQLAGHDHAPGGGAQPAGHHHASGAGVELAGHDHPRGSGA
jgi:molybdenum cofactor synthesis domain-containing protein